MATILHTIQIISAVALIALVLMNRSSNEGGSAFGESSFMHTRRGAERFLFGLTVVIAITFAATSIAVIALA